MFNSFEEEYIAQVQRVRDLRNQEKYEEAALEESTLGSINQRMGFEDISELDTKTITELEIIHE